VQRKKSRERGGGASCQHLSKAEVFREETARQKWESDKHLIGSAHCASIKWEKDTWVVPQQTFCYLDAGLGEKVEAGRS